MSKYKVERVGCEDAAFREMSAEVRQTGPDSKQLIGQNYEFLRYSSFPSSGNFSSTKVFEGLSNAV